MENRVTDWKIKTLSYAGRTQLIRSVLASIHIYGASVFILPKRITDELESKMRGFLWSQGGPVKGKAKVSWKSICCPKKEGGLGLRRLADVNKALIATHIWSLLTHRESLWVQWIHSHRIHDRNFWDITIPQNCSWSWRKIMQIRELIRPHIWSRIGNGRNTMVWFDRWVECCPIRNYISNRDIMRAGLSLNTKVSDLISNGVWKWPTAWLDLFPVLITIPNLQISQNDNDTLYWKDADEKEQIFSAGIVWNTIRVRRSDVPWHNSVWFKQMIPSHAFLMWLIFLRKLKTQDKIMQWSAGGNMNFNLVCCPLCNQGPDSHDHLFFTCIFSSQVWIRVRHLAQMQHVSERWEDITAWMMHYNNSNSPTSVTGKLLVAATAYLTWQERNSRLFSNNTRNIEQIVDIVASTVRLKIVTMRFKNTTQVNKLMEAWNVPRSILIYDDQE